MTAISMLPELSASITFHRPERKPLIPEVIGERQDTKRNVTCGHEYAALASLEFVEGGEPLGLTHLPMDGNGVEAQRAQHVGQLPRVVHRPGEDYECGACQLCQVVC